VNSNPATSFHHRGLYGTETHKPGGFHNRRDVATAQKLGTAQVIGNTDLVPDSSPLQPSPSRRDRRRQETVQEIRAAARRQLTKGGPLGISLRGIARELGMTASGVHYYFSGRQALLDALVTDGFASLAGALRRSYEEAAGRTPDERWVAVCRAHREWALSRPSEYLLLYGHDGRATRPSSEAARAMSDVVRVLFDLMRDALANGDVDVERVEAAAPPALREQLEAWRADAAGIGNLPVGALAACMVGFAQLHGAITLELIGRWPAPLSRSTSLFDFSMAHIAASLHP
jgi:AcrR family transcriptional regulator